MEGNQASFCNALDTALQAAGSVFRYAEIGIGYGGTLNAVGDYLSETGIAFQLHGCDIPEFSGNAASVANYNHPKNLTLHLVGSERFLSEPQWKANPFHFIFIDGCHGEACARRDFLIAEKIISPGGVIAFHDTDPGCQDIHFQPHCGTGIRVRAALEKLGLLDDSREGWRKLDETSGDKSKGGHGMVFVLRS